MLRRTLIAWLLVTAGTVATGTAAKQPAATRAPDAALERVLARFDSTLAADVAHDGVGSITAAVVRANDVLWTNSFGWADPARDIAARRDHLYRVGSISKTVTAVVLLRLVEQGVVALDDPVIRHLPAFAGLDGPEGQVADVTLRHLASHTGGLIREPRLDGAAAGPIEQWEDKILASIPATSLQAAPGTEYAYSNIGYGILGMALSRAAGRPFRDLVHELVFRPLGVEHDVFVLDGDLAGRLAAGHAQRRDGTVDTALPALEHRGRGYKVPNGGVYASVDDLARFIAALAGTSPAPLLSAASRRAMQSIQTPGDPTRGYGLGLSLRARDSGVRTAGHGGSVAGYTAHVLFDPQTAYGVILLRNYNRGRTDLAEVAGALLDEVASALAAGAGAGSG